MANSEFLSYVISSLECGQPVVLATVVGGEGVPGRMLGRKLVIKGDGGSASSLGSSVLDRRVAEQAGEILRARSSPQLFPFPLNAQESSELRLAPGSSLTVFIDPMWPPEVLLIAGAGHVAQPLSRLGKMLGFRVVVIDDRPALANAQRFPDADEIRCVPYLEGLNGFPIGTSTYVVIVTREHEQDEAALRAVLDSPAAYVGMVGSKRKVADILGRLESEGVPRERIERVYSPIGLDIGAQTPEEIAVSIAGEIVNIRRRGQPHPHSLSVRQWGRPLAPVGEKPGAGAEAAAALGVFRESARRVAAGETVALATIVAASGPVARGAGTKMMIAADGSIAGTIGGGIGEHTICLLAPEIIGRQQARIVHVDLASDAKKGTDSGYGTLEVFVEPVGPA